MEELNLESCLRSVWGWSADIHVVDSGSTDGTLAIAGQLAHHVHHHPYIDHASQIAYVIYDLPLKFEWVLLLDADNAVSAELKNSIDGVLAAPNEAVDGYYAVHRQVFRGQTVRGLKRWWLRLVRHRNVELDDSELVDWRLTLRGTVGYLGGVITEHNLKENDIDFWIDKHQKFSSRMAIEEALRRAGRIEWSVRPRLFGTPDERMIWFKSRWYTLPLYVRPFLYFSYRYFWRLGFLDGPNGFLFHFLQAFWFRLIVDVKLSDLERRIAADEVTHEDLMKSFGHSFNSRRGIASGSDEVLATK
jgi:glycosyltransferase involved in cell wall biosynthesis